jgi:hypothetical protein
MRTLEAYLVQEHLHFPSIVQRGTSVRPGLSVAGVSPSAALKPRKHKSKILTE